MRPAHQRLGAAHAPGRQIDLRLVMQRQLAAIKRAAQLGFQPQPALGNEVHARCKETECAAPGTLGPRQRNVGALEQILAAHAILGENTDADIDVNDHRRAVNLHRCADSVDHPLRQHADVRFMLEAGHHQAEFVGRQPRCAVSGAGDMRQTTSGFRQNHVAGGMTEGIVQHAEAHQINPEHGHAAYGALGSQHGLLQAIDK